MRGAPFFRRPPVITAIAVILLSGCLGKSQSTRFYALTPMPEDRVVSTSDGPAKNSAIGIGPIKLADYLDQSKLVTRASDNRLVQAEFDQWAGSFKDNLINVLAENIGFMLPTNRIYVYPWRTTVPIDYQIMMDVVRFDGELGQNALLVARWSLLGGSDRELLEGGRASIREPVKGSGYSDLVAAQSRALTRLSQEIVDAIKGSNQEK
jgi:uncharacterized lipoprotein YmbA